MILQIIHPFYLSIILKFKYGCTHPIHLNYPLNICAGRALSALLAFIQSLSVKINVNIMQYIQISHVPVLDSVILSPHVPVHAS